MSRPGLRTFVTTAAATLVLVVFAPTTATADDPSEMTQAEAGQFYAQLDCAINTAADTFVTKGQAIFDRKATSLAQVRRRWLPDLRRIAQRFGTARYEWSRALMNPPAPWPAAVSALTAQSARQGLKSYQHLRGAEFASSVRGWIKHLDYANAAFKPNNRATILATLDLPQKACTRG